MKKILALLLVVCALFGLVSCGEKEYSLGIGVAVTPNAAGLSAAETVAAVVLDGDGKIVSCRIDTIEVALTVNDDGTVDTSKTYSSKAEKGDDYGMSAIGKDEWYKQAQAFEKYVVGKTASEVSAINGSDSTLIAGCTINAVDFVKAVTAACNDNYKVGFETKGDITLGVSTVAAVADKESKGEITVDFGAVAMVDGKAVAATVDCAVVTIAFNAEKEGTDVSFDGTKRAQGDDYGMSAIGKVEWYKQAQAFADLAVGKSATEIAAIGLKDAASCTIYAGSMKQALDKAAKAVR